MILKALDVYYILALSKRDFKPFLNIEKNLLGFAGCCFFQKLPPEAQLNHETYVFFFKHPPRRANYIRYHTRSYIRYHTIPYIPYHTTRTMYHTYHTYIYTIHAYHAYDTHMIHTYDTYIHGMIRTWFRNVLGMI